MVLREMEAVYVPAECQQHCPYCRMLRLKRSRINISGVCCMISDVEWLRKC
jgi:hypothetical protein